MLTAPLSLLYPDMGFAFFIKGFAAAVLGGLNSLPGAVLGGILVGIVESMAGGYIHSSMMEVSPFMLIMLVLIVCPTGILGLNGAASLMALFGRRNILVGLLLVAAVVPVFPQYLSTVRRQLILIYVLLAIGLNILVGYAGQLAFANAAMFGIGAYGTALLQVHLGWPFYLAFPAGALLAMAVGLMISLPALRLSGLYLALSTLAFAQFAQWVFLHLGHRDLRCRRVQIAADLLCAAPCRQAWRLVLSEPDRGRVRHAIRAERCGLPNRTGLRRRA